MHDKITKKLKLLT